MRANRYQGERAKKDRREIIEQEIKRECRGD